LRGTPLFIEPAKRNPPHELVFVIDIEDEHAMPAVAEIVRMPCVAT